MKTGPASRDGVGASCVVMRPGAWATVLDFLADRFPGVARDDWLARLRSGDVVDEAHTPVRPNEPCQPQRRLWYFRSVADEPVLPCEETLLYCDAHLAVVDKPHGLPVVPAGRHVRETLLARVKRRLGVETAAPVHRLDRDTAGLVLFSLRPATRDAYHALFRERRVAKCYEAIAPFSAGATFPLLRRSRIAASAASFMQMQEVPGPPNTETRIDLLEANSRLARYELRPSTGHRHQLRVHMAALGLAIVNDRIYPVLQPDAAGDACALAREQRGPLQLLARRLAFTDPVTGQSRVFESLRRLALEGHAHPPAAEVR